jgi:hypothetical protein
MSRLLDPAYLPGPVASSSYSSGASSSLSQSPSREVYVDHRGDLHDPDYRHFPAMPTTPTKRRSTSQRVPAWERGYSRAPAYDLDEDDEDADGSESEYAHSFSHSRPLTPVSRVTRSASNPARARPKTYSSFYSDTYYSDHGQPPSAPVTRSIFSVPNGPRESHLHTMRHESFFDAATPVDSYVQEPQQISVFVDDDEEELSEKKTRRHLRRRSKKSTSEQDVLSEKTPAEQEQDDSVYVTHCLPLSFAYADISIRPSCSDSLRVALKTLSLRLRFSIFRAKRSVRRKIVHTQSRARDG